MLKKHIYKNISLIKKLNLLLEHIIFSKSLNLLLVKLYSKRWRKWLCQQIQKIGYIVSGWFILLLGISHVMLWKATQKAASAHWYDMRLNFRSDSSSIYTERGRHVFHSVFSGIFSTEQRSSHGKINIDIKQQSSYLNIFLVF